MPKRTDLHTILVIGSGPIVIGQACEFDYSGVQACKALREEGYRVVLINSNPATIMTDPEFADRTYIEPITPDVVASIIEEEAKGDHPIDALLPTLGGQTALNCSLDLYNSGTLDRLGVQMIGAKAEAIRKGEDRQLFKDCMLKIGLDVPHSGVAHSMAEANEIAERIGRFPLIIRPAFTMGGSGGGIGYNREEFEQIVRTGLDLSPVTEVLVEESMLGWKEFEMEVMRDCADNCVIVCSIENLDPMGVHTGDSVTVAPIQTLTDKEYQIMRDASFAIIREIGVETGGSNIQFSVDPKTGRMIVIEMNPRVSRSSALASKATGFPIAKIAAKLAVGYTLDEIPNDITQKTPASFEPTLDYVVTKCPRFAFEKFAGADSTLTTQMKSVGEAMAIGRTFKESLQKALNSLEIGAFGLSGGSGLFGREDVPPNNEIQHHLATPNAMRLFYLRHAFRAGFTLEQIYETTSIDPWFLSQFESLVKFEQEIKDGAKLEGEAKAALLDEAKQLGFSDRQIALAWGINELDVRAERKAADIVPAYRLVDTCAAEFEAYTPYYYSTYDRDLDEVKQTDKKKIMILGGGPNRIGQGIEFDYCCVHASFALREAGFETIMVNSNPETVSTDYDTSDKLFFEPLTLEHVLNIYERENVWGVIVQFGGQTPLNLAAGLEAAGVNIIGTPVESIDRAEDRKLFQEMLHKLGLRQPPNATATTEEEALAGAREIGYPVLVRPSFVLGGRAMQIVYNDDELERYMREAVEVSNERPVLVDRFLNDAIEVDVDCIADGETAVIGAIMQHIEQAGVHSGDSACSIPAYSLSEEMQDEIREATLAMAKELGVRGLMNVQYAVKDNTLYVIEANPRASRTVPFVSKAIGVPLAKYAARIMAGSTLPEIGLTEEVKPDHYCVKEAVFPFIKFRGVDILLGPEMRSTGEVMGQDDDFGLAYAKSQLAAGQGIPAPGKVFLSVRDFDKENAVQVGKDLVELGFTLCSTSGTAKALKAAGVPVQKLYKVAEGRPNVLDLIKNEEVVMVINTPSGPVARVDEVKIRTTALYSKVPVITTLAAAQATVSAIRATQSRKFAVKALQDYQAAL